MASPRGPGLSPPAGRPAPNAEANWRTLFCGRAAELRALMDAYDAVAAGGGPRVVVVLGDRGMGKTRLVREFYTQLVRARDPDGYWPDASLFRGHNLLVGPDVERDPAVREHFASFSLGERRMPFLWWGVRLADPAERNAVATDLATHYRFLELHLEPWRQARELEENREELKEVGRDVARSGALKLVELIPVAGPVLGVLVEGALAGRRAARLRAERQALLARHRAEQVARLASARTVDLIGATLAELETLFAAPAPGAAPPDEGAAAPRVPLVLFVDDAQFARAGGDEGMLRLLVELWTRAASLGWPLLLVAAHWEREWRAAVSSGGAAGDAADAVPESVAAHFRAVVDATPGCLALSLGREPELAGIVRAGLPGLSPRDVALLLERADGNPQLLIEIVERVRRSPAWRTADGWLSDAGRTNLATARFDLHELLRQRMEGDDTPPVVRQALAVSAVQGMAFSCSATEGVERELRAWSLRVGLEDAERAYGWVAGVEGGAGRFVQRAVRDAALALVDMEFGSASAVQDALARAAAAIVGDGVRWESLSSAEQDAVLALRATLGEHAPDPVHRLAALDAMLESVERAVAASPAPDLARAASWGRRVQAGLADGRWDADDLPLRALARVEEVVRRWDGAGPALSLTRAVVERLEREARVAREGRQAPADGEAFDADALEVWLVPARWELCWALVATGNPDAAREALATALARARALHERAPSGHHRVLLEASLERWATWLGWEGDVAGQERALREALALGETAPVPDDPAAARLALGNRVSSLLALAEVQANAGRDDDAVATIAAAQALQSALTADADVQLDDVRRTIALLVLRAEIAVRAGEHDIAATCYTSALDSARELYQAHPMAELREVLVHVLDRACHGAWAAGDAAAAAARNAEARALLEEAWPPSVPQAIRLASLYRAAAERAQLAHPDPAGSAELEETLGDLLRASRALLAMQPTTAWDWVEIAGRLGAQLALRAALGGGDSSGGAGAAGAELAAVRLERLRGEVLEALRACGREEAATGWYWGGLEALEQLADGYVSREGARVRAAALETALRWALEFADAEPGEDSLGDVLYWTVLAGSELAALGVPLPEALVRACAIRALAPAPHDEAAFVTVCRSPALALLATHGTALSLEERRALVHAAGEWYERASSPIGQLAGYEAEVETGLLAHDAGTRCAVLTTLGTQLPPAEDGDDGRGAMERRFLERLRRKWGCVVQ